VMGARPERRGMGCGELGAGSWVPHMWREREGDRGKEQGVVTGQGARAR
jgi:hypothetical protein